MQQNRENKKKYFAECFYLGTRQSVHFQDARKGLCRVPREKHSAKPPALPRARSKTHGKAGRFAECPPFDTRQSWSIPLGAGRSTLFCRVRICRRQSFAECPRKGTRQSWLRHQIVCRVFKVLCLLSLTLGKPPVSHSGGVWINHA